MNIGFIGYGEVGSEMSKSLSEMNVENIFTYDPLKVGQNSLNLSKNTVVSFLDSAKDVVKNDIDILFVAVPASYAISSWNDVIDSLDEKTVLVDLTTANAEEKKQINKALEQRKLELIDGAILGALKVYQHRVPILASGKNVSKFINLGNELDMNIEFFNENVGDATNFKFVRSIFTKGLSTLLFEVFSTAQKLHIEDEIFNSITSTMDKDDFGEIINRYIKSNVPHSKRRETEMKNVIDFIQSNDTSSSMTVGTLETLKKITATDMSNKLENEYNWKEVIDFYNKN